MAAAVGVLGQLGISASSPVDARLCWRDEALVLNETADDFNNLRGTRSHNIARCRLGLRRIGGPMRFQPNAVEMGLLLPWILGAAGTGSPTVTYALADTLLSRYVTIDRVSKVFTYNGVKVDTATFRAAQGTPLEVDLGLVGIDEAVANSGTFPSLSIDAANGPWIFADAAITIGGTTVTPRNIEIAINNHIDKERYFNSLTLASVESHDRSVMFSCMLPYGDYYAIYGSTTAAGATVVATFTNANAVLTMTMTKVVLPRQAPTISGKVEIMLPLSGRCYQATNGTREIVVTLNPGP